LEEEREFQAPEIGDDTQQQPQIEILADQQQSQDHNAQTDIYNPHSIPEQQQLSEENSSETNNVKNELQEPPLSDNNNITQISQNQAIPDQTENESGYNPISDNNNFQSSEENRSSSQVGNNELPLSPQTSSQPEEDYTPDSILISESQIIEDYPNIRNEGNVSIHTHEDPSSVLSEDNVVKVPIEISPKEKHLELDIDPLEN